AVDNFVVGVAVPGVVVLGVVVLSVVVLGVVVTEAIVIGTNIEFSILVLLFTSSLVLRSVVFLVPLMLFWCFGKFFGRYGGDVIALGYSLVLHR
ncbi:1374_t:CDS:2, partial [Dentiscutata heterogama]